MKKITTLFTVFILISLAGTTQAFKENYKLLNLGIGLGSPYFGTGYSSSLPVNPTITYEKGVSDEISTGITASYTSKRFKGFDLKYNAFYLGVRGSYHFALNNNKLDPYLGGGLGYVVVSVGDKTYGTLAAGSGVGYSFFAGGRYYWAEKASLYAELGYGSLSILNLGVSFKFQ